MRLVATTAADFRDLLGFGFRYRFEVDVDFLLVLLLGRYDLHHLQQPIVQS